MGELEIPGMPLRFSEFPELLELEAPLLGEHNEEILSGLLQYDTARIEALAADGVLVRGDS
ncbi:MAG: hypothetical protein HKP27_07640 [Myxococcales bacterium]|nr:hypothetical protein [Myxococcales bacterium]